MSEKKCCGNFVGGHNPKDCPIPKLESMFKLKQDDWMKVCQEVDALQAELEAVKKERDELKKNYDCPDCAHFSYGEKIKSENIALKSRLGKAEKVVEAIIKIKGTAMFCSANTVRDLEIINEIAAEALIAWE